MLKLIELTSHYRVAYRKIVTENQQRKALRHLIKLGIVISYACFYQVIKDDNRQTITDQSSASGNIEMIEMSTNIDKSEPSSNKAEPIHEKTIKV
jgi:hypothetical protein